MAPTTRRRARQTENDASSSGDEASVLSPTRAVRTQKRHTSPRAVKQQQPLHDDEEGAEVDKIPISKYSRSRQMNAEGQHMFRVSDNPTLREGLLFPERPRQLFFLTVTIAALAYVALQYETDDVNENIKVSLTASCLTFLMYCFLQTKDGLLVRPHPGLWRVVHGIGLLYLVSLSALSVSTLDSARNTLRHFFPEIGNRKTAPEMYKLDCTLNANTMYRGVTSIWFLAHVAGWWGKMCMFRDWRFCWVLSIAFEVVEASLQFVIPDFQECWWDSVIMDTIGANFIGMCLGTMTLWYLESARYDWSGKKQVSTIRRTLWQFLPFSWSKYHWQMFSSMARFFQVVFALLACLAIELNAFFLLYTLDVPKESNLNKYRLVILFFLALPATAEYYEFVTNPFCDRLGQNSWLILSISCVEVLVWVKFLNTDHIQPVPLDVSVPWGLFLLMMTLWFILYFGTLTRQKKTNPNLDYLFWLSFVPLCWLAKQWAY